MASSLVRRITSSRTTGGIRLLSTSLRKPLAPPAASRVRGNLRDQTGTASLLADRQIFSPGRYPERTSSEPGAKKEAGRRVEFLAEVERWPSGAVERRDREALQRRQLMLERPVGRAAATQCRADRVDVRGCRRVSPGYPHRSVRGVIPTCHVARNGAAGSSAVCSVLHRGSLLEGFERRGSASDPQLAQSRGSSDNARARGPGTARASHITGSASLMRDFLVTRGCCRRARDDTCHTDHP